MDRAVQVILNNTDRYGRMVADIVLPDGRMLNKELVHSGNAWWYSHYAPNDADLQALEADAREHHRGLWAVSSPMPPWEWRNAPQAASHRDSCRSAPRSERRSDQ
jgi:endonuclease YncB( thermonuclease family)